MKRGYVVYPIEGFRSPSYGFREVGVIASSAKVAKKLAFASGELIGVEWIDIRVKWIHSAEVQELPMGVVSDMRTGLLCGIYDFLIGYECAGCGKEKVVILYDDQVLCEDCVEEEYIKEVKEKK